MFSRPVVSDSLQPMDCSTSGLPVSHRLLKFAQVHVHCIGDAIQPFHPLIPSSPPALNLPQHQRLFQWVSCSHQMTRNRIEKLAKSVLSPFCKICLSVSLSLTLSVWLPSWTGLSPYFCLLRLPPASNTVAEHALEMSSTKNSLCLVLIF